MFKKRGDKNIFYNKKGQFFLIAAVIIIVVIVSVVTISNYSQQKQTTKLYDLGKELGIESQNVLDYGTYSSQSQDQMKTLMEQFINNYRSYLEQDKNIYFVFGNSQIVYTIAYQDADTTELACISLFSTPDPTCYPGGQTCDGNTGLLSAGNGNCDHDQIQCKGIDPITKQQVTNCCNNGESCGKDGKCKTGAACKQGIQCSLCINVNIIQQSSLANAVAVSPSPTTISIVAATVGDNIYQFSLKSGENFYFVIWQKIGGQKNVITSDQT